MRKSPVLAAIFTLLLLSGPAFAIGISPGRISDTFTPNMNVTHGIHVVNSENRTISMRITLSGDLAKYMTANVDNFTVAPGEVKGFDFNIALPESIEPGKHEESIGASEIIPPGAGVSAVAGVAMQYWLYANYPEKYVSVDVLYTQPEVGKDMMFNVTLFNPVNTTMAPSADLEIQEVQAGGNLILKRFDFGSTTLQTGGSQLFNAYWTFPKEGDYVAVARAYYDGQTTRKEIGFGLSVPKMPEPTPSSSGTAAPGTVSAGELPAFLKSPYTAVIAVLIVLIIAVLLWPEKRLPRPDQKCATCGKPVNWKSAFNIVVDDYKKKTFKYYCSKECERKAIDKGV